MDLDPRKRALLQAIVVNYVRLAEPVGSQFLAANEGLGVRSATIRNELAEMTELGYLRQPHTSAGRIPSDLGYRFYVDHLMPGDRISRDSAAAIRDAQRLSEGDLEQLLLQTCRVLSSLTRYTSVATPPAGAEPVIKHVHLVQVEARRLLVVVVLDNGQVVHRFCEIPRQLSPARVTQLGSVLDTRLRDVPVSAAGAAEPAAEGVHEDEDILRLLHSVLGRGMVRDEGELFLDGASRMLEQPEFREANKVEPLIRFLEGRKSAYESLQQLLAERTLAISIGHENPHASLHEVSLVAARYGAGSGRFGWIAVLGPTRMHYGQALSAVQFAAGALTETLSRTGSE